MTGSAPQDDRCAFGEPVGLANISAFQTSEAVRPSQMLQISRAGLVIGKNPLKLGKCCRKAAGIHLRKLTSSHRIGKQPDRQGSYLGNITFPNPFSPSGPPSIHHLPNHSEQRVVNFEFLVLQASNYHASFFPLIYGSAKLTENN